MGRPHFDPFDRRAMGLSAALHAVLFGFGWASALYEHPVVTFVTYEIELVSPAPAVQAEISTPAAERIVIERPDPEPPAAEVGEAVPVEAPEPTPREEESRERPLEPTPEVADAPAVASAPTAVPEEEPDVTGEDINVRIEGLRRDYPEYYESIIGAVRDCFRWRDGGRWETTLFFYIDPDGRITSPPEFVTRSGSVAFDFGAMGAVDCAGRGRIGPLPASLPRARFPIRFTFRPSNAPMAQIG